MAKKKHAEEHENLERWLVSYADFMTLLFATFVVLYALAQTDVHAFKSLEAALRSAFSQGFFNSEASILSSPNSILDGQSGATSPLMLEYMSQKYEQTSYDEIKDEVEKLKSEDVSAEYTDKGLVIRLNEKAIQFAAGTAEIKKECYDILDVIAGIIKRRFSIHYIEVEGHSDSDTISTDKYPSNWELSSARASSVIRYLIKNHNFNPKIFTAVGLADTIPIAKNDNAKNKEKNRRVEIVILKNKLRNLSKKDMQEILKEAKIQQRQSSSRGNKILEKDGQVGDDSDLLKNVIDMSEQYQNENKRIKSLEEETYLHDGKKPTFMEQ